jgi:threonine aldolase
MPTQNRRDFLKTSTLSVLPALMTGLPATTVMANEKKNEPTGPIVKFYGDSDKPDTTAFLNRLLEAHKKTSIEWDAYGQGGVVAALEKKFEAISGKEKAIFMPSGTLANQLAISVLSGTRTKIFVQDTSHVYRDEADAAQSVFQKRLMPLARDSSFFTAAQLKTAIEGLKEQEVFESGVGAVSIENPVRRNNGRFVPLEEIKKISDYCRANGLKLHLDGARIYMASVWSGISIKECASYFDTVYISLYKYLGANAGAILCGDKATIDKMLHLIKVHGGSQYSNWPNAAMALLQLDEIENRLQQVKQRAKEVFALLNQLPGLQINAYADGTNMYPLKLSAAINGKLFHETAKEYNVRFPRLNDANETILTVNETLLYRDTNYLVNAFKNMLTKASL